MMRISLLAIVFLLFPAIAAAQDWQAIENLRPGTRILITTKDGREMKGKTDVVSASSIVVRVGGRSATLAREHIATIHLTRRGSVLKRTLVGAAAGAGIGVLVGVVAVTAGKADPLIAAGGFLLGIPVGAAVGAATTGRTRGSLIYSSP